MLRFLIDPKTRQLCGKARCMGEAACTPVTIRARGIQNGFGGVLGGRGGGEGHPS